MMPVPDILIGMYSVISNAVALVMDIQSPIVYSKDIDDNNEKGCLTWNPLDFDGSVALIKSGDCSNEMKVQNAQDAGALAVIIFNADSDLPELMSGINSPTIPATMIGLADANNVINYIHENAPEPSAIEILAETTHKIVDALGMVLYHSSLRGPNNNFNITKPDITAPGSHVFAAIAELGQPAPQYYTATGTSQSTAVISGSMALIKSLRPNLSPSEIKSVMMLSANNSIVFDNGNNTNPDDIGSGMLDLVKAVNTPLVMDENLENYTNANPAIGGLAETLNIASLRNNSCANGCRWTRTLTNKSDNVHSWTISANTDSGSEIAISGIAISGDNLPIENISTLGFNLVPEQSISLEIEYRLLSGPVNEYRFATITFTSTQETVPQSQLSMVVYLDDFIFNNGFE